MLLSPVMVLAATFLLPTLARSSTVTELRFKSTRDVKTGLLNADQWTRDAGLVVERCEESEGARQCSVLMLDLDHFKDLNDSLGHLVGDIGLRAVAVCLVEELRAVDIVGRFGGEEFLVLLEGATPPAAFQVAERLCEAVAHATESTTSMRVTASIGVATYPVDGASLKDLLAAADGALFEAKKRGRNRVVGATEPEDDRIEEIYSDPGADQ